MKKEQEHACTNKVSVMEQSNKVNQWVKKNVRGEDDKFKGIIK